MYFWLYFYRLILYSVFHSYYSCFVRLIYWRLKRAGYVKMVSTMKMRQHSLCCTLYLHSFWSELVLQSIFIFVLSILQFLWQVLIFFHLASALLKNCNWIRIRQYKVSEWKSSTGESIMHFSDTSISIS